MEYNTFQHQDQTNSEALDAQEYAHMNDIAYHVCPDLKKKKDKEIKIDLPTLPILGPKGQTNLLFFRPYDNKCSLSLDFSGTHTYLFHNCRNIELQANKMICPIFIRYRANTVKPSLRYTGDPYPFCKCFSRKYRLFFHFFFFKLHRIKKKTHFPRLFMELYERSNFVFLVSRISLPSFLPVLWKKYFCACFSCLFVFVFLSFFLFSNFKSKQYWSMTQIQLNCYLQIQ